jgi:hypothetical protein
MSGRPSGRLLEKGERSKGPVEGVTCVDVERAGASATGVCNIDSVGIGACAAGTGCRAETGWRDVELTGKASSDAFVGEDGKGAEGGFGLLNGHREKCLLTGIVGGILYVEWCVGRM